MGDKTGIRDVMQLLTIRSRSRFKSKLVVGSLRESVKNSV